MLIKLELAGEHNESQMKAVLAVLGRDPQRDLQALASVAPETGPDEDKLQPARRGRPPKAETGSGALAATAVEDSITNGAAEAAKDAAQRAETGQLDAQTADEPSPLADTGTELAPVDRKDVLANATLLTQKPGGNAHLKELFAKYGAEKFSGVPDDRLAEFNADVLALTA